MWKKIYIKNDLEENLKLSLKLIPHKNLKPIKSIKRIATNLLSTTATLQMIFGSEDYIKEVAYRNNSQNCSNQMEVEQFREDPYQWEMDQIEQRNVNDSTRQQQLESSNLLKTQLTQNKEKFEENLKNSLNYYFSASQIRKKGNAQTFNLEVMLSKICIETWEDNHNIKHQIAWSFSNFILYLQTTQLQIAQPTPFSSLQFTI